MNTMEPERDDGIGRSLVAVAVASVALTLLAPLAFGKATMLGVAIGGALALGNLWAISAIVRGFLRGAGLPWAVFGTVKFSALLLVVWIVLRNDWADVMPLVVGYAALPLGIVLEKLGGRGPTRQKI